MDSAESVGEASLLTTPGGSDSGCNEILSSLSLIHISSSTKEHEESWDCVYKCSSHGSLEKMGT